MFPKRVFGGDQSGNKNGNIPIYFGLPISKTDTDLKNTPKRNVQFIWSV